jgi:hypothetical protein
MNWWGKLLSCGVKAGGSFFFSFPCQTTLPTPTSLHWVIFYFVLNWLLPYLLEIVILGWRSPFLSVLMCWSLVLVCHSRCLYFKLSDVEGRYQARPMCVTGRVPPTSACCLLKSQFWNQVEMMSHGWMLRSEAWGIGVGGGRVSWSSPGDKSGEQAHRKACEWPRIQTKPESAHSLFTSAWTVIHKAHSCAIANVYLKSVSQCHHKIPKAGCLWRLEVCLPEALEVRCQERGSGIWWSRPAAHEAEHGPSSSPSPLLIMCAISKDLFSSTWPPNNVWRASNKCEDFPVYWVLTRRPQHLTSMSTYYLSIYPSSLSIHPHPHIYPSTLPPNHLSTHPSHLFTPPSNYPSTHHQS